MRKISVENARANQIALWILRGLFLVAVIVGGYFVVEALQAAYADACTQLGAIANCAATAAP